MADSSWQVDLMEILYHNHAEKVNGLRHEE